MAGNSLIDSISRNIIEAQAQYSESVSTVESQWQQIELCLEEAESANQSADEARAQSDRFLQEARNSARRIAQLESEREHIQRNSNSSSQDDAVMSSRLARIDRQIAEERANKQQSMDQSDVYRQKADDLLKRSSDLRRDAQQCERQLAAQCDKCGSIADSLGKYTVVMRREAASVRTQATAIGRATARKFGYAAATNAQQCRERQAEALENYAEIAEELAEQYRALADTKNNLQTKGRGQSEHKYGSTVSERVASFVYNAVVAGSITAGFHGVGLAASSTFDSFGAQAEAISEALENVGQDDFLDGYEILGSDDEDHLKSTISYGDQPRH